MAATTCKACGKWLRVVKPPAHMEGQVPDRVAFHRVRPSGPICPGSGRSLPLHAEKGEAS